MSSLDALRAWRCRKCGSEAIRAQERYINGFSCQCGNCGRKWFSRSVSAAASWTHQQNMRQGNYEQRVVFETWLKDRNCKPVAWLKDAYWEVWQAAVKAQEQQHEPAGPDEQLINIANHIAGSAGGLPVEWHDWASELVSDLRSLAASKASPAVPQCLQQPKR